MMLYLIGYGNIKLMCVSVFYIVKDGMHIGCCILQQKKEEKIFETKTDNSLIIRQLVENISSEQQHWEKKYNQ